jgi:hypothetical protein
MMMMMVVTKLTSQRVHSGANNEPLHAESGHPDEKQHHMVSKNHAKLPTHHPKLLTRHDGDADWHGVDSPRVHSGATMDDYMLNLTIPSKSNSTW